MILNEWVRNGEIKGQSAEIHNLPRTWSWLIKGQSTLYHREQSYTVIKFLLTLLFWLHPNELHHSQMFFSFKSLWKNTSCNITDWGVTQS